MLAAARQLDPAYARLDAAADPESVACAVVACAVVACAVATEARWPWPPSAANDASTTSARATIPRRRATGFGGPVAFSLRARERSNDSRQGSAQARSRMVFTNPPYGPLKSLRG